MGKGETDFLIILADSYTFSQITTLHVHQVTVASRTLNTNFLCSQYLFSCTDVANLLIGHHDTTFLAETDFESSLSKAPKVKNWDT